MMIWCVELLPVLPTRLLCALHRDICLCKGKGWGGGGPGLAFVWRSGFSTLHDYHIKVMGEMRKRGWNPGTEWLDPYWRGKGHGRLDPSEMTYGPAVWPELGSMLIWQARKLMNAMAKPKLWQEGEMNKFSEWIGKRLK